jgi:hypothetical protein
MHYKVLYILHTPIANTAIYRNRHIKHPPVAWWSTLKGVKFARGALVLEGRVKCGSGAVCVKGENHSSSCVKGWLRDGEASDIVEVAAGGADCDDGDYDNGGHGLTWTQRHVTCGRQRHRSYGLRF